jgi:DNA-directed RNA polymerase specialized sigma24 family protein
MRDRIGSIGAGPGVFTGDATRAVARAWPRFAPLLERLAAHSTPSEDEAEDLVQEAWIQLWQTDPTRFDLRDPREFRYLRRILVNRMWRVRDRETDPLLDVAIRFP